LFKILIDKLWPILAKLSVDNLTGFLTDFNLRSYCFNFQNNFETRCKILIAKLRISTLANLSCMIQPLESKQSMQFLPIF